MRRSSSETFARPISSRSASATTPLRRLDVRAVDVERRERERQVLDLDFLVQAPQLGLEDVHGDLELRQRDDVLEAARVAGELPRRARSARASASRFTHSADHVVQELVARRPFDRPVAQLLTGLEDLLRPHVLDAGVARAARSTRPGSASPSGWSTRTPSTTPSRTSSITLACVAQKTSQSSCLQPAELADVEEAPVEAGAQVDVEEHLPQLEVAPERALVDRRHVVRDDVEDHAEPGARERAELLLAAERVGDARAGRSRRSRAASPLAPAATATGRGARCRGRAGTARARAPPRSRTPASAAGDRSREARPRDQTRRNTTIERVSTQRRPRPG